VYILCISFLWCILIVSLFDIYSSIFYVIHKTRINLHQEKARIRAIVFNATFNNMSVHGGGHLYWWIRRKPEYQIKSPNCRKSLTNFIT
jgi:hypothetical protein